MAAIGAAGLTAELPELWVSNFDEILGAPYDVAVVGSDADAASRAIEWMARMRAELGGGDVPAPSVADRDVLQAALSQLSS